MHSFPLSLLASGRPWMAEEALLSLAAIAVGQIKYTNVSIIGLFFKGASQSNVMFPPPFLTGMQG
jgi:hypothetical protein